MGPCHRVQRVMLYVEIIFPMLKQSFETHRYTLISKFSFLRYKERILTRIIYKHSVCTVQ
jgi:hypothetical protein